MSTTEPPKPPSIAARVGRAAMAVPRAIGSFARRLLFSARAWVLAVVVVIVLLVTYYVLSDLHTPFTTDAYVQAYVIQVAPRIEGQVIGVYVKENQSVKKGELLFEIDPRPFGIKFSCCGRNGSTPCSKSPSLRRSWRRPNPTSSGLRPRKPMRRWSPIRNK